MTAEAVAPIEPEVAQILEVDEHADLGAAEVRARVREALEGGDVVFLARRGFALTEHERRIITDRKIMFRGGEERSRRNGRPTLTFDPARDRLLFTTLRASARREIENMMRRYAVWARDLLGVLAPDFAAASEQSRIIYRPVERHNAQGLHVDSSHRHPTQGRSKLRIFCNIDPEGRPRVWEVGERFEVFAQRYLPSVRSARSWSQSAADRLASLVGFVEGERTAYDDLLEDIRRRAKEDRGYQKSAPHRQFPGGLVLGGAHRRYAAWWHHRTTQPRRGLLPAPGGDARPLAFGSQDPRAAFRPEPGLTRVGHERFQSRAIRRLLGCRPVTKLDHSR